MSWIMNVAIYTLTTLLWFVYIICVDTQTPYMQTLTLGSCFCCDQVASVNAVVVANVVGM